MAKILTKRGVVEMRTPCRIITVDVETMTETDNRIIDHSDRSDRQWLGAHSFWALRNKHGVQTAPIMPGDAEYVGCEAS